MTNWHGDVYRESVAETWMNNPIWRRLRLACLRRDGYKCRRCRKKGKGYQAHHIIPRDEGGGDYLGNLVTLCTKCHDEVEILRLRTLPEISCMNDTPVEQKKLTKPCFVEDFERPEWHKWVYGGVRRPQEPIDMIEGPN